MGGCALMASRADSIHGMASVSLKETLIKAGLAPQLAELLERMPTPPETAQLVEGDAAQSAGRSGLCRVDAPGRHANRLAKQPRPDALLGVGEGQEHVHGDILAVSTSPARPPS